MMDRVRQESRLHVTNDNVVGTDASFGCATQLQLAFDSAAIADSSSKVHGLERFWHSRETNRPQRGVVEGSAL